MNGTNVLLVEDSSDDAELFVDELKGSGLHVEVVITVNEAINLLEKYHFCSAFVDLDLPGASGIELVKWINQNHIETPVYVLTGAKSITQMHRMLLFEHGAMDVIFKPFNKYDLQRIKNFLASKRANYLKGKVRPSYWTTITGVLVVLAGIFSFLDRHDAMAVGVLLAGIGLIKAQDGGILKDIVSSVNNKKEN